MCGRYVSPDGASIEREFNLVHAEWQFPACYNVAPTQQVPVVRHMNGVRQGARLRWGLIPYFAKGDAGKHSTINARIETMETAASYRDPWRRGQRCLQVAMGFYEWHEDGAGRKAPYYIHLKHQPVFAFAGLWDKSVNGDGSAIESCAHITMPGNELMREIHNAGSNPHRMPVILRRDDYSVWLNGSIDEARGVLKQYDGDLMVAYEVSTMVNTPENDSAALLEPVTPG